MRKRRRYRKNGLLSLLAVMLVFSVMLSVCFFKIRPVIIRYAVSNAETILLDSANDAILDVISDKKISYEDIVSLSRDENGYVTSIETNIIKINSLKSCISNRTSEIVTSREFYNIAIPLGTFFSNTYTAGFGPKINFKMQLTATAIVNFSHEFKSAGINQVLHIVHIDMKISGSLIIVGYSDGFSVSTSAIAAQTVIVGVAPGAYTSVIESESDNTAGLINDYGAAN